MAAMALFAGRVHKKQKRAGGKKIQTNEQRIKKTGSREARRDLKIKNVGRP